MSNGQLSLPNYPSMEQLASDQTALSSGTVWYYLYIEEYPFRFFTISFQFFNLSLLFFSLSPANHLTKGQPSGKLTAPLRGWFGVESWPSHSGTVRAFIKLLNWVGQQANKNESKKYKKEKNESPVISSLLGNLQEYFNSYFL